MNSARLDQRRQRSGSDKLWWRGKVAGLHIAPRPFLPLDSPPSVNFIEGKGIDGDRYAEGRGYLTEKIAELGVTNQRHVTLFEQETLDWLDAAHNIKLAASEHRRNVTTQGVPLNHLFGKTFRIGEAVLLGFETTPCKHLEEVTGHSLVQLLINRSGLNARIIVGGVVNVGDIIEPVGR